MINKEIMESLVVQFQKALWACDGGDLDKDSTGVARRAWNLLNIICRILEPGIPKFATYHCSPSSHPMRNLDACRKIYSRVRSSEQNDPSELLDALQNAMHFMFAAAAINRDPAMLGYAQFLPGDSHSPEDFDWLVDYLDYIYSDDQEAAYDILLILGTTPANDEPDPMIDYHRDLCYLELVFALAKNSDWHPHLSGDRHVDRFILVLVGGTKKYMQTPLKSDLEQLIGNVDHVLERLEQDMQWKRELQETRLEMVPEMGLEMQGLELVERITIAVKELRTAASNKLESFD
ncbi:hypothetical protein DFJ58DRAFT_840139 [Suillus subalutaceus]|uniref:uncharacterized protein n=1 Tax=Suillus subalutaceus TaxID=48586 RepID=UPI001B87354F|nr:uncharacterized protein DFJ58DRAFT_840139 [Suillus subalutaceus]KAG1859562.1 hypothetical protein DFJ58DRAFT_840139 [Suillus subalutaceus]